MTVVDDFHQMRRSVPPTPFTRDLGPADVSARRALARGLVQMSTETTALVAANALSKGDVLATARVAALQAAKATASLLPMAHPVLVGNVQVNFHIGESSIAIEVSVDAMDRTGVAMEALTAVSVAALTIYDMCKSVDPTMVITDVTLVEKSGGRSGTWKRPEDEIGLRPEK